MTESRDWEREQRFLETKAREFGFFEDIREAFLLRFDRDRECETTQSLAQELKKKLGTDWNEPYQAFRYRMQKIEKTLAEKGFSNDLSTKSEPGAPKKGEEPWRQIFNWLWNEEYPNWTDPADIRESDISSQIRDYCKAVIEKQKELTTNPLTSQDGVVGNIDDVHVPLALVERKKKRRLTDIPSPEEGSQFYSDRGDEYEIIQEYEGEEFFRQILNPDNGIDKRFAIIGEPGAGKTTFLVKIADRILETSDIPIWISLAALEVSNLEDYLPKIWLKNALKRVQEPTAEQQKALADLFATRKVWLLLDGADEMAGNPLSAIARQFRVSWIDSAKAVLTCRLNVWEGDRNALSDFKPYLTRNFQYPDRVQ